MFLDTTVLIEILQENAESIRFKEIYKHIEDDILFISIIQLAEVSDWCLREKLDVEECVVDITEFANVIPLSNAICLEGSKIKFEMRYQGAKKFSLIDGLILASARAVDQKLLTTDSDFRKADDAILLKKH